MGGPEEVASGLLTKRVPGYKIFRLDDGGWFGPCLRAQYIDWRWVKDEAHAICQPGNFLWKSYTYLDAHESPSANCHCGLHAYYDADTASCVLQPGMVMALVSAAGKIIPHDDGFRAARMRVDAVYDPMRRAAAEQATARHGAAIVRSVAGLEQLERRAGERLPR